MNIPRLLLAIVVAFVVIFATDFLIHGIWLKPDYDATKAIWRPEGEMHSYFQLMMLAQILCATAFMIIWAQGFAGHSVACGIQFGIVMGIFQQVWAIVDYVVLPMPGELAVKWYFSGLVQAALIGIVAALVYKPRAATMQG